MWQLDTEATWPSFLWMKKSVAPIFRPNPILPGVPLGLLRSRLFQVGCASDQCAIVYLYARPLPMAAQRGERLAYRGPRLSQQHALAWQAVLAAAEGKDAMDGKAFEVSPDKLLRLMGGKGGDRSQRQRLARWLADLTIARIDYTTRLHSYSGPLVASAVSTATGRLCLRLAPELRPILRNEVLRNDLARKARLGLNSLAMWLHDYIATHLRPPPDSVDRLRHLSGSPLKLPQFRIRLRAALALLHAGPDPLVIQGGIDAWDRLIIAKKAPTPVVILTPETTPETRRKQSRPGRKGPPAKRVVAEANPLRL